MTRKHYERTAAAIRRAVENKHDKATAYDIALSLAEMFAADNPRFDESTFFEACGFED